jgi:hypothetical protein
MESLLGFCLSRGATGVVKGCLHPTPPVRGLARLRKVEGPSIRIGRLGGLLWPRIHCTDVKRLWKAGRHSIDRTCRRERGAPKETSRDSVHSAPAYCTGVFLLCTTYILDRIRWALCALAQNIRLQNSNQGRLHPLSLCQLIVKFLLHTEQ